jgi:hypothetical protein
MVLPSALMATAWPSSGPPDPKWSPASALEAFKYATCFNTS